MQIATYIKLFFLSLLLGYGNSLFAAITIDSSATQLSNCANDGSITVYAKSPTAMLFAIVNGPEIRPAQNGNQFGALPSGVYQVMVTNFSNDTAFVNATVGGTYQFPDFSTTFTNPICPGSYTGMIVGIADSGTGKPPYNWVLTNTNTGVVTTQSTDTFYNLNDGSYSLRMFDSCSAFATRYVSLAAPYSSFNLGYIYTYFTACDTLVAPITINPTNGIWANPYIITTFMGSQSRIDTFNFSGNYAYPSIAMGGAVYGSGGYMVVNNACGISQARGFGSDTWDPYPVVGATTASCQHVNSFGVQLSNNNQNNLTSFWGPVTFQVWDSTAHVKIDSTVVYGSVSGYYAPYYLQQGHLYRLVVYDSCGNYSERMFSTAVADTTHKVYVSKYGQSCFDSTGVAIVYCTGYGVYSTSLTILSGPSFIKSTKPLFSYYDTIIYPRTGFPVLSSCGSYNPNEACFGVGALAKGIYTYQLTDSCGYVYTDTFVIRDEDLTIYNFEKKVVRGCPGQNKVDYHIRKEPTTWVPDFVKLKSIPSGVTKDSVMLDSSSFQNLNAGWYQISNPLNPYHSYIGINANLDCYTLYDTIYIPPYQTPQVSYATQIKCNGTVNVGLQPDSSKGVPPYSYEIISGPQTASVQASQFFTLNIPGTYVARISDTCGFARAFSFFVDTLSFQQIVKIGSSCLGNSATLVSQHSPYATYVWQKPNGSFYMGDSLYISPILPTDYGIYHIKKIVSVNNCSDTFYTTYSLLNKNITYFTDTICSGYSSTFAGNTYTQSGTYYDTIPTAFCDSILQFDLLVKPIRNDSVLQNICSGRSVIVGTKTYNIAGIYRDTLTSSLGCDSIHILNLQILPITQRDTILDTICNGQSYVVGAKSYNTSGVYQDTLLLPTGCRYIQVLQLFVEPAHYVVFDTYICTGDSFKLGNNYYKGSGSYVEQFNIGRPCDSFAVLFLHVGNYKYGYETKSLCPGQQIVYAGHVYDSIGNYTIDTIPTSTCDSIHVLHIVASSVKIDSVSQTICTTQSVTVGSHTYNSPGIYRDTFSTINCDSIHVLNLKVVDAKRDTVSQIICEGQSIHIGAKNYTTTGSYQDTFATPNCDSIRVLNLTVRNAKRDTILQSICEGQSITIGGKNYSSAGSYRDTFSTINCDSIRVLNLQILPAKRDTLNVRFCEGESVMIDSVKYTEAGFFTDTFATIGCDSLHTIQVTTFAKPVIQISAGNEVVEKGDTVQLNVSNGFSYQWTSSAILSNPFIQNPTATISESSWVMVQATDANNCKAFDSLFITVKDCEGTIYVPNAFTPNADERNDGYRIFGRCIKLNRLLIFNRWGEKVWETNNIEQEWNGYYKGILQPTGVYVYWLSYSLADGKAKDLKGSITLIR